MKVGRSLSVLAAGALTALSAGAAPLAVYGLTVPDELKGDPRACIGVGDAISCSAGMLNVLSGKAATTKNTEGGYVIASPQGALKTSIVLGTGGNASTDNSDVNPATQKVEDGFKTNSGGASFAATGKTSQLGGNLGDPGNNGLNPNWDRPGTWDVDINWLIGALTIEGTRRNMVIGFDYNQPQNATESLNYWALITAIDYNGTSSTINRQINYEIGYDGLFPSPTSKSPSFPARPDLFSSAKTIDSKPKNTEFGVVEGITCYQTLNGQELGPVTGVLPIPAGQCPAQYPFKVNNAKSDSTTEIVAFLPELSASLETLRDSGYDAISVRMLFGCFNNAPTDNNYKGGVDYLDDGSGPTTRCDGGGNVDVYLLAEGNSSYGVPSPGSLALLGAGALAAGFARRRNRRANG